MRAAGLFRPTSLVPLRQRRAIAGSANTERARPFGSDLTGDVVPPTKIIKIAEASAVLISARYHY